MLTHCSLIFLEGQLIWICYVTAVRAVSQDNPAQLLLLLPLLLPLLGQKLLQWLPDRSKKKKYLRTGEASFVLASPAFWVAHSTFVVVILYFVLFVTFVFHSFFCFSSGKCLGNRFKQDPWELQGCMPMIKNNSIGPEIFQHCEVARSWLLRLFLFFHRALMIKTVLARFKHNIPLQIVSLLLSQGGIYVYVYAWKLTYAFRLSHCA